MKCPRCGNEVSRDEAFCGQCGAPNSPPASPTEMVSAPLPPQSGRLSDYSTSAPLSPPGATFKTRQLSGEKNNISSYPSLPSQLTSMPNNTTGPNKQTGFYQDATQAMSSFTPPNTPGQPVSPFPGQQQGFPPANYPGTGQPGQPPYQNNNYASPLYVQSPIGATGQAYMNDHANRGKLAPAGTSNNTNVTLIVSLCVMIALASVIVLGAVYFFGEHNRQTAATTPIATATTAPAPSPTVAPSPTAAPTPTPVLTPTPVPTTPPDPGFQWCSPACTPNDFLIEYPVAWSPGATTDLPGYQYVNPAAADEVVAVKAPPGPTASQPGDLLAADLQTNFQSKPGYTPPAAPPTTATIGGTTWLTQVAYYQYQNPAQPQQPPIQVRVMVFATVYQQRAYIIELQADNAQFDTVNQQAFTLMLAHFSFQPVPTA
jgi:hypothetical protein